MVKQTEDQKELTETLEADLGYVLIIHKTPLRVRKCGVGIPPES
jgi:hypothetical protein